MATDLFASGGVPDASAPTAGADLFADTKKPAPFKEGFGAGVAGVKSNLFGAGALVAHAVGADKAEAIALDRSKAASDEAAAQSRSIENVDWTSPSSITGHFKYLLGNALPSLATMAVGGAAGRGLGALARAGTKALNAATLAGAVAPDVALEAGGIYPEALKTGVENPATRAAVGGAAAASLDFVPLLAAEKYLKAAGRGGFGAMAKGAAKGAPVGAVLEGAQEAAQSVIERAAAGQSMTDAEAMSDYLNSFAGGAAPGALFGAGIGAHRGAAAPANNIVAPPANNTVEAPVAAPIAPVDNGQVSPPPIAQPPLALEPTNQPLSLVPKTTPLEDAHDVHNAIESSHTDAENVVTMSKRKLAALDAELKLPEDQRRGKKEIVLEQRQLAGQLATAEEAIKTLAPKLEEARAALKTQQVLAEARDALNPEIKPKAGSEIPIIGKQETPDTTAAETAVAQVKRSLGHLVSSREAKLAPLTRREQALEVVNQREGRSVSKDVDAKTRQGAIETAAIQAAQPAIEQLTAAAGTPKANKVVLTNALNKIAREAAAKGSIAEAQQHIGVEVPKALKGRVKSVDAAEVAATMINAVGEAHTLYSKGATDQTVHPELAALGVTPDLIPLFIKAHDASLKPSVTTDPYIANRADKTAYTRTMNTFARAVADKGLDYPRVWQKITAIADRDGVEALLGSAQQSVAALTTEQFFALPQAAKNAAVDFYDKAMADRGLELRQRLQDLIGHDPHLTVHTFAADVGSPIGTYTRTGKLKSLISMATNAKNGLSIADHEGFHYAEDRVLDSAERQVVRNAFAPGSRMFKALLVKVQAYDLENRTHVADDILSIPAEARAYGFEFWKRGELKADGMLARAFEKMKLFFESVANYVKGLGFQSIEDVFTALDRGQFAEREKNQGENSLLHLRSDAAALEGLPLAEAKESLADMERRFKNGELEREQLHGTVAQLMDSAQARDIPAKDVPAALAKQAAGTFTRARTYLATGNHISKFSNGYKNVMKALSAQEQYKNQLIADGSEAGLSLWHAGTQNDRDDVFSALLKRRIGGFTEGSVEFNALRAGLASDTQRNMFDQVSGKNGVIAKMLNMEFAAEQKTLSQLMTDAELEEWKATRGELVKGLIDSGYVPLRRYGDHVVRLYIDLKHADGTVEKIVVAREQYEHEAAAIIRTKQYAKEFGDAGSEVKVERGIRQKNERDSEISIQQFLDLARRQGIRLSQPELEKLSKSLISADSIRRNRMMRSRDVPGYSKNGWRVLNEFVTGTSGKIAHAAFSPAVNDAIDGKPVDAFVDPQGQPVTKVDNARNIWTEDGPMSGFYKDLADKLADRVLAPGESSELSTKLKAAAMTYFIGGSIGAGMVQMFSVPMNTVPYLSQHTSYNNAFTVTSKAWSQTMKNSVALRDLVALKDPNVVIEGIDADLRQALILAAQDGTNASTEIHQIMGISRGGVLAQSRTVQKAMNAWMWPFKFGESTSRIASFIAAFRIGQENGLSGRALYDFARTSVDETQNRFDPVNRPAIASHPIGSLLFMFKSFPLFVVEMIETMFRQNPKAGVFMLLGLVAMTGVQGLPFAEDILDIVDVISQRIFNSPFQVRRAMRNVLKDASEAMVGVDLSNLILRGAINDILGFNVASRVGNGDLVPGTRIGAADSDYGKALEQLLGAPASMVVSVASALPSLVGGVTHGDLDKVLASLRAGGPVAMRNAIKGYEQLDKGFAQDAAGNKLVNVSGPEAFWQSIGVSSGALAKMYDLDAMDKQRNAFYKQVEKDMSSALVRATRDGNADKIQEVFDARTEWNTANPDMQIMPNIAGIRRTLVLSGLPLNERTQRLLPRALRGTSISGESSSQ